ncbi:MAG: hypothetical protein GWP61_16975 [Chloroflexi bacterium]|jgi:uncharacterized membrane protein YhhN|nr:hypothetical protein [Chloroflexota bacterium]
MFTYLDNPAYETWLTFLLALWAILLVGGFVLGSNKDGRRMPAWTRLASSLTLVVAGFSWAFISREYGTQGYALFLTIGMTFGFLGDLLLAHVLVSGKAANMGGIVAFAVGHVFYITAIWRLGDQLGADTFALRFAALITWWLVAGLGWYFVVFRGSKATFLHWFVLPYALLLATTAGAAMGLALQVSAFWPLVIGAALFLASDTLIGGNWFNDLNFNLLHDVIWLTYGSGQMLIVYSVGVIIQHIL